MKDAIDAGETNGSTDEATKLNRKRAEKAVARKEKAAQAAGKQSVAGTSSGVRTRGKRGLGRLGYRLKPYMS